MTSRRHVLNLSILCAAALAAPYAQAQTYPSKPIRIVVPFGPGGATDVVARTVADKLSARLGQPVIVDNKPGANSLIGVDQLAKSAPDGYTFGVVIAAYAANTTLYPKLPYNARKDLVGVSLMGVSPLVAAVSGNAPFKNTKELVAYARANPGKVSFASSGSGSAAHLTSELLKTLTKTYMVHIPYRGASPALADLLGGQVPLFLDPPPNLIQPAKAGRIHLIGVASEKRLPILPDVPTFVESGVPDFVVNSWVGLLAPAGTPAAVVTRLNTELNAVLNDATVREKLRVMGIEPAPGTPEQYRDEIRRDLDRYGAVVKSAGISVE